MPDSDMLDGLFGELATADLPVPAPARVVARGRQRRRRARARTVIAAAAAVAGVVVGVTQLPRHLEAAPAVGQRTHPAVCAAAPDAALNAELRHALPASQQQSVSVIGLSPNHAVLYLMTTTAGFHGIAAESVATGAITQTLTPQGSSSIYHSAQGGLGPDGDVVFNAAFSSPGAGSGLATVAVWSPRTISWSPLGQMTPLEPPGEASSSLSAPVFAGAAHQLVAWEAQDWNGNSVVRQIVEADLLTGVTDVVASGNVGAPVFVGDALVWPVASSATGPTHLVAVSASAFRAGPRVAVPLPLRNAGGAAVIVSSGDATAYASADRTRLFYAPSLTQPARQVLRLPPGSYLSPGGVASGEIVPSGLAVGPGYLAWSTSAGASYVASAKTLAAIRITDGTTTWGAAQGLGDSVLASRFADPASVFRRLYLLSGSVIDRLTCARPVHAPG
ncbi:MAG: hypothetical protein WBH47_05480 [Streptosporangiaceae bacterium]